MTPDELMRALKGNKPNKYRAKATTLDGIKFHSKKEAERYATHKLRERAGEIRDLVLQPRFPLIVNGQTVAYMIADFGYTEVATGADIVEDVKSPITRKNPVYRLKKKFFEAQYGRKIREV